MELLILLKMMLTIAFLGFISLFICACDLLLLKPKKLRSKLRKQGISGPPPSFLVGNLREVKMKLESKELKAPPCEEQVISHDYSSALFPFLERWRKEYGSIFMFSLGNLQIMYMKQPDMVKEISTCTSLNFGKPSYQSAELGPLLGQGILTSNGAIWANQRKILAPELHMDKVKGMMNLMVESSITLLDSWKRIIESEGGIADIKIDEYMTSFSANLISRACFGSNYSKGKEIFVKLRALQDAMSKKVSSLGVPGLRYLPTKNNREIWTLEKEVRSQILMIVKERKEATSEKDLLQMILEAATNSDLSQSVIDAFIVDNCKNIYLAGYETAALTAAWCLMLLASNPEWQDRVRAEAIEVSGGRLPDADMVRKMKTLTMVIHETLRLYPPGPLLSREALQDMKLGEIHVPKGVIAWIPVLSLHHDPELWGPDAHKFNPERFANGVSGACKLPCVYMPFGAGLRSCLGQNFAMAELKILLSLILSNFSVSLSPKYKHSPIMKVVTEPEYGVNLLIKKL